MNVNGRKRGTEGLKSRSHVFTLHLVRQLREAVEDHPGDLLGEVVERRGDLASGETGLKGYGACVAGSCCDGFRAGLARTKKRILSDELTTMVALQLK